MTALRDQIFESVFPAPSEFESPTPAATPILGSSGFDQLPNSPHPASQPEIETGAAEQIRWNGAWHVATTYLSLPDESIRSEQDEQTLKGKWLKSCPTPVQWALEYTLATDSQGRQLRRDSDDLLQWYFEEVVVGHYMKHMLPGLIKILENSQIPDALFEIGQSLYVTQTVYVSPLKGYISQILPGGGKAEICQFERDIHGLFVHTLPRGIIAQNLKRFFEQQCSSMLADIGDNKSQSAVSSVSAVRRKVLKLTKDLQSVGLGGINAQRILAEVMSESLTLHIKSVYAGQWMSPSTVVSELRDWTEDIFARLIVEILASMRDDSIAGINRSTEVNHTDVARWQDIGISKLGALRSEELFNVIVEWDESRGAIEDLKGYVISPASRTFLTLTFSNVVSHRLLQPGASTTEILQVYVSIIRAFTFLDPKGVLLDRVARPIRRYLRERNDTVNIVVSGLLADPEDENTGDVFLELAIEMSESSNTHGEDDHGDGELDFDDLNWMPDPIDAGPEYKKSKNSDVIGSLISLFESKDVFVKEFQNVLGERLLKREYEFDREIRVLELLKLRFGEAALQACEVMLRDILDSRRVDTFIHKDQQHLQLDDKSAPDFHTRILSHLFWPPLHSESFFIPPEVSELQTRYSASFETLKQSRKLTWLHALGQVTVTLDLEDRTIVEEVQTWQASVIYAFQPIQSEEAAVPVTRTFDELLHILEMTESLLQNALTFWVGKLVLKQTSSAPLAYTVLETLSNEDAALPGTYSAANVAAAETATATAAPAVLSAHEVAQEKMDVYSQYVVGMLTNGGAMPLQQIVMMLKLTVPGGFPFGNEELKSYLEDEVRAERLDFAGGNYKIKH